MPDSPKDFQSHNGWSKTCLYLAAVNSVVGVAALFMMGQSALLASLPLPSVVMILACGALWLLNLRAVYQLYRKRIQGFWLAFGIYVLQIVGVVWEQWNVNFTFGLSVSVYWPLGATHTGINFFALGMCGLLLMARQRVLDQVANNLTPQ